MKTGYIVMDIMTTNPVKITPNETIMQCAKTMKDNSVGSLLVMNKEQFTGIITERDIVTKVVALNKNLEKTFVREMMTPLKDIVSIEPRKDIYEAMVLMKEYDVRRLPVMEKGVLKGFITVKDIVKIEPTLFELLLGNLDMRESERKMRFRDEEPEIDEEDQD
jgi:CBS domain-containing protein